MESECGREARRKRIVDRGSDRMSLITGRMKYMDSSSSSSSSSHYHHSHTQSSLPVLSQPLQPLHVDGNAFDSGSRVEPQLRKCETNTEAIRGASAMELRNKLPPPLVTARVPNASDDMEPLSKATRGQSNIFTPKEISSCIIASENTRVFCSIMIAILVVLSYMSLPRTIVKSKSIIASRPLYVLLLTDFTIVIARLIVEKRGGSEKPKEEEKGGGTEEDGHNWGGAVKVLEMGLVLHQIMRAIFIDCSFYLVIVVCGLSLV